MNISQWKIGDRTFFYLEVDDRLLLLPKHYYYTSYKFTFTTHVDGGLQHAAPADGGISMEPPGKASNIRVSGNPSSL